MAHHPDPTCRRASSAERSQQLSYVSLLVAGLVERDRAAVGRARLAEQPELGGAPVVVREGSPPRRPDGTIAGAALRLDEAVANAVGLGVAPAIAIDTASRVPADVLRRADLGRIAPGAAADLVWLGEDFRARAAWVGSELVHGLEETPA